MDIHQELEPLSKYLPQERLRNLLTLPTSLMPEQPDHLIPSLVLSGQGVILARILLVTSHYLCDVPVVAEEKSDFDFIAKTTIQNYRVSVWEHNVMEEDKVIDTLELAKIEFLHDLAGFRTQLDYAGHERDSWFQRTLEAIPITLVLPSS